jgi:hypothetical protein
MHLNECCYARDSDTKLKKKLTKKICGLALAKKEVKQLTEYFTEHLPEVF